MQHEPLHGRETFKRMMEKFSARGRALRVKSLQSTENEILMAERAHDNIMTIFKETMKKASEQVIGRLAGGDPKKLKLRTLPVPVVHADNLSVEKFITEHAIPGGVGG